ncbi:MAG TPA: ATP-grasp domain-containing protein [Candidatus Tumulicola sp.]
MRILISAGGTVTAQSLIKALREDGRASFIAIVDLDELNATKFFVDEFVQVPRADDPKFVDACLDVVKRLNIELFVPIIVEREFLPIDARRDEFTALGCHVTVPPRDVVTNAGDKLAFAQFLDRSGIEGPRTVEYDPNVTPAHFPVYLKPRRGSGSVGTQRILSLDSLHEAARGRNDLIVQDEVEGTEFTVDCFATAPGRVVAAIPRERIMIKAGVSVKGRTYRHDTIEAIAADVVAKTGITGPANVQGMLRTDGSFPIVEMNPRFSGTLALSTASGVNFATMLLDMVAGKPVADMRGKHRAGVTMMRYWSETFEEADGTRRVGPTMTR